MSDIIDKVKEAILGLYEAGIITLEEYKQRIKEIDSEEEEYTGMNLNKEKNNGSM